MCIGLLSPVGGYCTLWHASVGSKRSSRLTFKLRALLDWARCGKENDCEWLERKLLENKNRTRPFREPLNNKHSRVHLQRLLLLLLLFLLGSFLSPCPYRMGLHFICNFSISIKIMIHQPVRAGARARSSWVRQRSPPFAAQTSPRKRGASISCRSTGRQKGSFDPFLLYYGSVWFVWLRAKTRSCSSCCCGLVVLRW